MTEPSPRRPNKMETEEPQVFVVFDTAFVMTFTAGAVGLAIAIFV